MKNVIGGRFFQSSLKGLQATAGEIDGVVGRDRQTLVLLGDSLHAGDSIGTNFNFTKYQGQVVWANALAGHPFSLIYNAGVGGEKSHQILARVDSDVIAKNPSHCIYTVGMNNDTSVNGDVNAANTNLKNDFIAIYEKLNNAGIYSFICTNTTTLNNPNRNKQAMVINNWLYSYFKDKPNCEIVDYFGTLADTLSNSGYQKANYHRDSTHWSNVGAFTLGKMLAEKHFKKFKTKYYFPATAFDDYTVNNSSNQLVKNPLLTGSVVTSGTGRSGFIATNHSLNCLNNATCVASKETRADGYGDYQVLDINSVQASGYARWESISGYIPKIGDKVYAEVELIIESCTNLKTIRFLLYTSNNLKLGCFSDTNGGTDHPLNITEQTSMVIRTQEYTCVADETNIFTRLEPMFMDVGTMLLKIGRVAIRKVD